MWKTYKPEVRTSQGQLLSVVNVETDGSYTELEELVTEELESTKEVAFVISFKIRLSVDLS